MSFTEAGLVMSLTTLSNTTFAFVGGMITPRIGIRRMAGIGLAVIFLAQITSCLAHSFNFLVIARFMLGIGVGITAPSILISLAGWFRPNDLGMANGVQSTGFHMGRILSTGTAVLISESLEMGWRGTFYAYSIVVLAVNIIFWFIYREPEPRGLETGRGNTPRIIDVLRMRDFWLIVIGMLGNISGQFSVGTWLPRSLIDQGWSDISAASLAAILPIAGLPASFLGGVLSDRLGKRKPFLIIGAVFSSLSILTLALTSESFLVLLAVALFGFSSFLFGGPMLAIMSEHPKVGKAGTGVFFGLTQLISGAGSFVMPILVGSMRETTGSFASGFMFSSLLMLLPLIPGFLMSETGWRNKQMESRVERN